jgi:hypothetical protein
MFKIAILYCSLFICCLMALSMSRLHSAVRRLMGEHGVICGVMSNALPYRAEKTGYKRLQDNVRT